MIHNEDPELCLHSNRMTDTVTVSYKC